jgi:hypothetical protein
LSYNEEGLMPPHEKDKAALLQVEIKEGKEGVSDPSSERVKPHSFDSLMEEFTDSAENIESDDSCSAKLDDFERD